MATSEDISWELVPFSWAVAERLARELALPFPAATVLAGRGFADPAEARAFLDCSAAIPDPFLFADMEAVVDRLSEAIHQGQRVVVHGDYDADGVTATALMVLGLRAFGVEAESYLPSRFTEGFGLSRTAVESIASGGPALLVTVDCGVNYPDEVLLAKSLGLDVIVVDHHQPGAELPCCPLVHPVRGTYPSEDLCGVGLAFKVLHALHIRTFGAPSTSVPEALHGLLDLVAVGSIADLAPLRGENRYYVKEGLKLLTIGSRAGLRALSKVAGCSGAVDSGAVSFRIAPRLNAAGRLADASPPLRLLLTEDEGEATAIAEQLHELNGARQDVERQILEEALHQVESLEVLPSLLVLSGPGWHEGVVGIVASRLVERYHRPVILLGERDGVAKGSGRSIPPYDLMSGLNAGAEWLTVYGGHTQAVGLTLPVGAIDAFRQSIQTHAAERLTEEDVRPVYRADAVLRGDDISADTASALASLGPFGSGNPRPRLLLVDAGIQQVDVTRTGSHLRCVVEVDGVKARAIGFGMGDRAAELRDDGAGRILGVQLRVDEWQGALRPEFQLERIGGGRSCARVTPACGPECPQRDALDGGAEETVVASLLNGGRPNAGGRYHGGPVSLVLPPRSGRDFRGAGGRAAALAQVLATGEPTVVLTCSAAQCLGELRAVLPLEDFTRARLQCVGRGCVHTGVGRVDAGGVTLVEWDVATDLPFLGEKTHLVAIDPPYRRDHTELVHRLAGEGVQVHLYYGDDQRRTTARLLKYLVHPRFAMVCVYRALKKTGAAAGSDKQDVTRLAAEMAWREGRVVLAEPALARAAEMLSGLDLEQVGEGEAKISLDTIPLYVEAEAEYEECSRLCRIL